MRTVVVHASDLRGPIPVQVLRAVIGGYAEPAEDLASQGDMHALLASRYRTIPPHGWHDSLTRTQLAAELNEWRAERRRWPYRTDTTYADNVEAVIEGMEQRLAARGLTEAAPVPAEHDDGDEIPF